MFSLEAVTLCGSSNGLSTIPLYRYIKKCIYQPILKLPSSPQNMKEKIIILVPKILLKSCFKINGSVTLLNHKLTFECLKVIYEVLFAGSQRTFKWIVLKKIDQLFFSLQSALRTGTEMLMNDNPNVNRQDIFHWNRNV